MGSLPWLLLQGNKPGGGIGLTPGAVSEAAPGESVVVSPPDATFCWDCHVQQSGRHGQTGAKGCQDGEVSGAYHMRRG